MLPILNRFRARRGLATTFRGLLDYGNARRRLRGATHVGTVRLKGNALVRNAGILTIGDRVRLDGTTVRLEFVTGPRGSLHIGEGTYINYGTNISSLESLTIGINCNIGQYCIIMDADYHDADNHAKADIPDPVTIEDDVWIGARAIVMKGSHIGRGATIGANSVVRGTIPPYSIAAGNPARVIRQSSTGSADR